MPAIENPTEESNASEEAANSVGDQSAEVPVTEADEAPGVEPTEETEPAQEQGVGGDETAVASIQQPAAGGEEMANLDLMMDLPLEVVVELGQTQLPLSRVLSLGPGSVIELARRPGEPIDLYVNGQLIARGEVVVLNETFGFRVTEVVSGSELKMMGQ